MKKFLSFFSDDPQTKTEVVENDPSGEKFHVYKRFGTTGSWFKLDQRKTLDEARELAKSRGESVTYMGEYKNGKKMGVMDWHDDQPKRSPEEILKLRRKSYENYKPELNRDQPPPVELEVENKFRRKELKK